MRFIVLLISLVAVFQLNAKPKRAHGAHVHGAAKIDLAIEGDHASLQLTCDTHSLYGFEHKANTMSEKNTVQKTMKIFNEDFVSIFIFDPRLGCTIQPKLVELRAEGHDDDDGQDKPGEQHQSLFADYTIKCKSAIEPSLVQFNFSGNFPKVASLALQVVSDRNAISQTLKGKDGINLK
jgi:Protein of unknown function (DUF2796)